MSAEHFIGPFSYHPVLRTNHPIAFESPDHLHPPGTRQDNSRNAKFNEKIFELYENKPLKVLDIGCSGGGFVTSTIMSVGIIICRGLCRLSIKRWKRKKYCPS